METGKQDVSLYTKFKHLLGLLLSRSLLFTIAGVLFLILLLAGLNALEPLILKYIFDGFSGANALQIVFKGILLLLGLNLFKEFNSALSNWLTWRTRLKLHYNLLNITIEKIHRLPHDIHIKEGVGAIMTKLDRSIQGLIGAVSEISFSILPAIVYLITSLIVMVNLNWQLTLLVLVFAPMPVLIATLAAPRQRFRERTLLSKWTKIYSRFNEVLSGIITVRSFAMEDIEKKRFLRSVRFANRIVVSGVKFDSTVSAAQNIAVFAARICGIGLGGFLVIKGQITVGTLVAFISYMGYMFTPIQGLAAIYKTMQIAVVSIEQIYNILQTPDYIIDHPNSSNLAEIKGHIVFDKISFGYKNNANQILENIDFEAKPGEVIAIVGPSGAGKTTMMSLLQRFYDPVAGSIRLDNVDIRKIKHKYLRRNIGVVLQDALLFNESIRDNIAYGNPAASKHEIEAAAKAANIHNLIMNLEQRYDTIVGEKGGRFSAGERQRIAIARALLKNPPILILDEATSALDSETEMLVQEAVEKLIKGRTTFIIAHRLTTVINADRILVLNKGKIIEQGTHAALMRQQGYYYSLVQKQMRGLIAA
ncbi:MAG: ABC transporter [Planctomycetes bacterium GWF2_41_51]|nr:MAG: ABC transporter [Planctomycetes bacterium GWF2_41_51]HBG27061.1 ABC transporter [Phycisphaerales bacterium]